MVGTLNQSSTGKAPVGSCTRVHMGSHARWWGALTNHKLPRSMWDHLQGHMWDHAKVCTWDHAQGHTWDHMEGGGET